MLPVNMNSVWRQEMLRRLTFARRAAKLTQGDVAAEMAVSRQTVSSWERGATSPGIEELASLCALYGVSADQILYGQKSVRFGADDLRQIVVRHAGPGATADQYDRAMRRD